jgi:hypothetical protein
LYQSEAQKLADTAGLLHWKIGAKIRFDFIYLIHPSFGFLFSRPVCPPWKIFGRPWPSARRKGRLALVTYVTAGFPRVEETRNILLRMQTGGAGESFQQLRTIIQLNK